MFENYEDMDTHNGVEQARLILGLFRVGGNLAGINRFGVKSN